jgi:hypothetical protein
MATERALPEFVMVTDAKNCQVTISTNRPKDALAIAKFLERACRRHSPSAPREGPAGGALERQRRLVATLPQTVEQARRMTPCAAITGNGQTTVVCGHCGKAVTPGGACAYTPDTAMQASNGLGDNQPTTTSAPGVVSGDGRKTE